MPPSLAIGAIHSQTLRVQDAHTVVGPAASTPDWAWPTKSGHPSLDSWLAQAETDLAGLRMSTVEHPELAFLAAGAPLPYTAFAVVPLVWAGIESGLAIRAMSRCRYWSEVASLMERYVKSQGLYVVEQFVGHGIGQDMHEDPQVPNFVSYSLRKHDIKLEPGIVLAIEPMVALGTKDVRTLSDGWTVESITADTFEINPVDGTTQGQAWLAAIRRT